MFVRKSSVMNSVSTPNRLTTTLKSIVYVTRFSTTSSTVPSRAFLSYIGAFDISEMSWTGTTEDEIHAFVQTGLSGPIVKYFRNQFEVTRNNKVETSAGRAEFSLFGSANKFFVARTSCSNFQRRRILLRN